MPREDFIICAAFAIAGCVLNFFSLTTGNILWEAVGNFFYLIFYLLFIHAILYDVVRAETVTYDTFCGAVCAYFMLGIFFSSIYALIEYFTPGAFDNINTIDGKIKSFDLLYFSFMTLTTVGYGDIAPVSSNAKSFVMLEGVTGVFYIGILVSHLVSGVIRKKGKKEKI